MMDPNLISFSGFYKAIDNCIWVIVLGPFLIESSLCLNFLVFKLGNSSRPFLTYSFYSPAVTHLKSSFKKSNFLTDKETLKSEM